MANYDFKCNKCNKELSVEIRMSHFDIERENIVCCGIRMERNFKPENLAGIRTSSSPNRY